MSRNHIIAIAVVMIIALSCQNPSSSDGENSSTEISFKLLSPQKTGIDFTNTLDEENLTSLFNYINIYGGGGVGIGDIDNDGYQDVILTGNRVSSKLYLNKKDLEFEDITQSSGLNFSGWATGVSMADVNNDGWLDIYVTRSYHKEPQRRENLLFINNKNRTFTESAKTLGINDSNYSIGSSFFDYDRDGDLDLIVANHPRYRMVSLSQHLDYWKDPPKEFSSRLFRNDNGNFVDVTEKSGVLSYGFCLSLSTSDYNSDGWPDIYLTVDHDEEDIVLKNNKDGTFSYETHIALKQNTRSSMGIDAGDVNHDLHPDLMVVEMLPNDYYREKVSMGMQTIQRFNFIVDTMNYQYYQMRNFMHLNNGNGTFSDISQMAGIHKSDWSWSILFMDTDNDSWQDVFIGNGFYKDLYNKDNMKEFDKKMLALNGDMNAMNKLAVEYGIKCPVDRIPNFMYKNNGDLTFENISESAGFETPTISAGAAYGDLDNDGDLDLIINNIGDPSFVYENTISRTNNYLRVKFEHNATTTSYGSKVIIHYGSDIQQRELLTTRGYQGSSEAFLHFGLGKVSTVDKVELIWPNGKKQTLNNVAANQILSVQYKNANETYNAPQVNSIVKILKPNESGVDYTQNENMYDDYADQILIPHKMSEQGPFISKGDVNGDKLEDFFVGSPTGQAAALYLQQKSGKFKKSDDSLFDYHKSFEDGGSALFDADGDGDLDLLVSSAGYEFEAESEYYQPRLYINDGMNGFVIANSYLPDHPFPGSCVKPADFDNDGDMDVFIGGVLSPKRYPEPGTSTLLINNGKGQFTKDKNSPFTNIGMVKDAIWTELNGDDKLDLIIVGEWMPISFWEQTENGFEDVTKNYIRESTTGWWNKIQSADLDGNGLTDFVVGNLGLNYKYKASKEKPFSINAKDIDESGTYDIVLSTYYGEEVFPVRGRTCSAQQLPEVGEKFETYHQFSIANLDDLYGSDLESSLRYDATMFSSIILYQDKAGEFTIQELPFKCQSAPVNGIVIQDINKDSKPDIILAGNLYQSEIETGRADFGTGEIVLNQGNRNWKALDVHESGLYIAGDVKSIEYIETGTNKTPTLLVGNNRGPLEVVELINE